MPKSDNEIALDYIRDIEARTTGFGGFGMLIPMTISGFLATLFLQSAGNFKLATACEELDTLATACRNAIEQLKERSANRDK